MTIELLLTIVGSGMGLAMLFGNVIQRHQNLLKEIHEGDFTNRESAKIGDAQLHEKINLTIGKIDKDLKEQRESCSGHFASRETLSVSISNFQRSLDQLLQENRKTNERIDELLKSKK